MSALEESLTQAVTALRHHRIGAGEFFMYPCWCVEKGYARFAGVNDGTPHGARVGTDYSRAACRCNQRLARSRSRFLAARIDSTPQIQLARTVGELCSLDASTIQHLHKEIGDRSPRLRGDVTAARDTAGVTCD